MQIGQLSQPKNQLNADQTNKRTNLNKPMESVMNFFKVIKETARSISQGLSLTVLERGSFVDNAYTPVIRNRKK